MTRRTLLRTAATAATSARLARAQGIHFRSDVRLVEVYATVLSQDGRYVDGLAQDVFQVLDDGRPQDVTVFGGTSDPVSCAVLLDTTGSMERSLPQVRSSVLRFIDGFAATDSVAIYTFDRRLNLKQDFTTDKAAARRAVMRTRAEGETALFDALAETAQETAPRQGKKSVVVFTDGADNSSALSAKDAEDLARRIGIPLYTVAQGDALVSRALINLLGDIAKKTGGIPFLVRKPEDVDPVFQTILRDLQHGYLLAYRPSSGGDARWHSIAVALRSGGKFRIRAREGYYAD